ncbi:MAG: lamin tail domain-containing protein [Candidatus Omnitrophica bacterium]|nr:lamin tail domain-containing protein [Candidatus Omnitrophota bacterium]
MKDNDGIALILVVSVLAVAGIMAVSFAFTMRLELKAATNYLEATRASYLAEAGISYAQAVLKEDDKEIDSFEDKWYTAFTGSDVDNDGDGENDSKWIYVYNDIGDAIGRYAVLARDETSFLNINIADKQNLSPLKVTEGWTPYELDLKKFLASFNLADPEKAYEGIIDYRYGPDGGPGVAGFDDNQNQRVFGSDGIDNNADGIIDEAGEGIDEPMEFVPDSSYGDDNALQTPFELAKIDSIPKDKLNNIIAHITSYSMEKNTDVQGRLRENINFMNASSLAILLEEAGCTDPFQKAVNIIDGCDEDFSQSVVTKLYNRLYAVNRGPIGDWIWKNGHYESDVPEGEALVITWMNLPEGEYYIGVFGVQDELIGDVDINGKTQSSLKHGEILRRGPVSFENRILNLTITCSGKDNICYFSHLELYPRLGQEGFSSVEVRGVEGIRISEIMVKPVIIRGTFITQEPGGDWQWQGSYYQNSEPKGGRAGEGTWTWRDIPDGHYYAKLFGIGSGQTIGDVEIDGSRSSDMMHGDFFESGETVEVSGGKLTVSIQNNLATGLTSFKSIELRQEPDGEYIELVNLTSSEVNLGGWSIEGPSLGGWPASIPLGTVMAPHGHLALCVDKDDSQSGIDGNGISFVSIWGRENSAELHFLRSISYSSDLLSDDAFPGGNIITLKDPMGHIVDTVEYFSGGVNSNISMERSDPSYVLDSNSNGVPDNWYLSKAEKGATPGLPNNNDGMKEEIGEEIIEHDITEVIVKNKNFSSPGEIAYVPLSLEEWKMVPMDDVAKIADRLTVFGLRLEAEGCIVPGSEGGWKLVQRAFPYTDHFESGTVDSVGMWRWEEKDGLKNGYYILRIFGGEEEEISASIRLSDGTWTAFTPFLTPGPDGAILFGNIEVGTGSAVSTASGILELKIKNTSKTGGAHFDFIRLDPLNFIEGRVNINTASAKVLSVLPGIDEQIAGSIISNRPFGNKNNLGFGIGDLVSADALGSEETDKKLRFKQIVNLITVHSDIYRIIVTGQVIDKDKVFSEKKIWAVFER